MEISLLKESPKLCGQACKQIAAEMPSPCHPVRRLRVMQHQLPRLWHCHTEGCAVLFSRGHVLPGTVSSPPDCPANSRWQPAWLAARGGLTAAHSLAGLPTATSAPLQTSHISVQATLLFRRVLREGLPVTAEDRTSQVLRPVVTVQRQLALTEAMAFL